MKFNPFCMCCAVGKQEQNIRPFQDMDKKVEYMKKVMDRMANIAEEKDVSKCFCKAGDAKTAFGNAWKINGGVEYGAYSFSNKVSEEALKTVFCEYLTDNRSYGKKVARADTYEATHALLAGANSEGFKDEIAVYEKARTKLIPELKTYMNNEIDGMKKLAEMLSVK